MNERRCPNCLVSREDWPDDADGGYLKDGAVFCCRGCGEGTGCTCKFELDARVPRAPTAEEIRDDPASGRFVRSLLHETKTIGPEDYGSEIIEKRSPPYGSGPD
jgi:hypothetical protein